MHLRKSLQDGKNTVMDVAPLAVDESFMYSLHQIMKFKQTTGPQDFTRPGSGISQLFDALRGWPGLHPCTQSDCKEPDNKMKLYYIFPTLLEAALDSECW